MKERLMAINERTQAMDGDNKDLGVLIMCLTQSDYESQVLFLLAYSVPMLDEGLPHIHPDTFLLHRLKQALVVRDQVVPLY